jgi:hypothetical protein
MLTYQIFEVIKHIVYELKLLGIAPKIGKANNMISTPASPDQKKPLIAWLRDAFRLEPNRDYFLRLASTVEASAPSACPNCA